MKQVLLLTYFLGLFQGILLANTTDPISVLACIIAMSTVVGTILLTKSGGGNSDEK